MIGRAKTRLGERQPNLHNAYSQLPSLPFSQPRFALNAEFEAEVVGLEQLRRHLYTRCVAVDLGHGRERRQLEHTCHARTHARAS